MGGGGILLENWFIWGGGYLVVESDNKMLSWSKLRKFLWDSRLMARNFNEFSNFSFVKSSFLNQN